MLFAFGIFRRWVPTYKLRLVRTDISNHASVEYKVELWATHLHA